MNCASDATAIVAGSGTPDDAGVGLGIESWVVKVVADPSEIAVSPYGMNLRTPPLQTAAVQNICSQRVKVLDACSWLVRAGEKA